jgi:hypothetical protein
MATDIAPYRDRNVALGSSAAAMQFRGIDDDLPYDDSQAVRSPHEGAGEK